MFGAPQHPRGGQSLQRAANEWKQTILFIIIMEVFWMQDMILYVQIMVLETKLFFVTELHRLVAPKLV